MDPNANSILTQFNALSIDGRRDLLRGIIGQLRLPEWREIKQLADKVTFHRDILTNVPMEVCLKVVEHLDLSDLFVLRRVSRLWHSRLSSPLTQMVAIRFTTGTNLPQPNPEPDGVKAIVQQRLRTERGTPSMTYCLKSPVSLPEHQGDSIRMTGYSHGILAHVSSREAHTSMAVLDFKSGKKDVLRTEARDKLIHVRVSKLLIAVVSLGGHCHVWDHRSREYKSFRLPALNFTHFVVNGLKVVFVYRTSATHWGWDTGIARTIELATYIVMVAPHPTEDQLTLLRVGEEVYYGDRKVILDKACHMTVEQFAASGTDEFLCKRAQSQLFLLDARGGLYDFDNEIIFDAIDAQEIYDGQSSILLVKQGSSAHVGLSLWFSLEKDTIIAHSLSSIETISQVKCVGYGVLYALQSGRRVLILDSIYTVPGSPADMRECRHIIKRCAPNVQGLRMSGDSDYVVFMSMHTLEIWCFGDPGCHALNGLFQGAELGGFGA